MVENKRKPYPKAKLFRKGYGFFIILGGW